MNEIVVEARLYGEITSDVTLSGVISENIITGMISTGGTYYVVPTVEGETMAFYNARVEGDSLVYE